MKEDTQNFKNGAGAVEFVRLAPRVKLSPDTRVNVRRIENAYIVEVDNKVYGFLDIGYMLDAICGLYADEVDIAAHGTLAELREQLIKQSQAHYDELTKLRAANQAGHEATVADRALIQTLQAQLKAATEKKGKK